MSTSKLQYTADVVPDTQPPPYPCHAILRVGEAGYIALVARSVDAKDLVVRYNAYEALMEALLPLAQEQVSESCERGNCLNPFSCKCKQILKARSAYKNAMDSATVADVHEVMDRMWGKTHE